MISGLDRAKWKSPVCYEYQCEFSLIDTPMMLLGLLRDLPLRGLQQEVSATQRRPPEFGRRAAISLAECSAEMAVTGKTKLLA